MNCRQGRVRIFISLFVCILVTAVVLIPAPDSPVPPIEPPVEPLCPCRKCLRDGDPWFRAMSEASPKPFLTRRYRTSEDMFKWWKQLQWETRNFTFFNATLDRVFELFPLTSKDEEPTPNRCMTCAVVGNSGNLNGSKYGDIIDRHDIVIRLNRGRTKGYEADVGTKTTHHVMYPESAIKLNNNTHLVFFAFKISDLLWLLKNFSPRKGAENKKNSRIANQNLVMILNPAFMKFTHEGWLNKKGRYPSTGFMTLAFSMQICEEVSVFGFGADSDGNWGHYFEVLKNKKIKTGPHPGAQEYEIIKQFHEMKKITFYKGR